MADSDNIGSLSVDVTADTNDASAGLDVIEARLKSLSERVTNLQVNAENFNTVLNVLERVGKSVADLGKKGASELPAIKISGTFALNVDEKAVTTEVTKAIRNALKGETFDINVKIGNLDELKAQLSGLTIPINGVMGNIEMGQGVHITGSVGAQSPEAASARASMASMLAGNKSAADHISRIYSAIAPKTSGTDKPLRQATDAVGQFAALIERFGDRFVDPKLTRTTAGGMTPKQARELEQKGTLGREALKGLGLDPAAINDVLRNAVDLQRIAGRTSTASSDVNYRELAHAINAGRGFTGGGMPGASGFVVDPTRASAQETPITGRKSSLDDVLRKVAEARSQNKSRNEQAVAKLEPYDLRKIINADIATGSPSKSALGPKQTKLAELQTHLGKVQAAVVAYNEEIGVIDGLLAKPKITRVQTAELQARKSQIASARDVLTSGQGEIDEEREVDAGDPSVKKEDLIVRGRKLFAKTGKKIKRNASESIPALQREIARAKVVSYIARAKAGSPEAQANELAQLEQEYIQDPRYGAVPGGGDAGIKLLRQAYMGGFSGLAYQHVRRAKLTKDAKGRSANDAGYQRTVAMGKTGKPLMEWVDELIKMPNEIADQMRGNETEIGGVRFTRANPRDVISTAAGMTSPEFQKLVEDEIDKGGHGAIAKALASGSRHHPSGDTGEISGGIRSGTGARPVGAKPTAASEREDQQFRHILGTMRKENPERAQAVGLLLRAEAAAQRSRISDEVGDPELARLFRERGKSPLDVLQRSMVQAHGISTGQLLDPNVITDVLSTLSASDLPARGGMSGIITQSRAPSIGPGPKTTSQYQDTGFRKGALLTRVQEVVGQILHAYPETADLDTGNMSIRQMAGALRKTHAAITTPEGAVAPTDLGYLADMVQALPGIVRQRDVVGSGRHGTLESTGYRGDAGGGAEFSNSFGEGARGRGLISKAIGRERRIPISAQRAYQETRKRLVGITAKTAKLSGEAEKITEAELLGRSTRAKALFSDPNDPKAVAAEVARIRALASEESTAPGGDSGSPRLKEERARERTLARAKLNVIDKITSGSKFKAARKARLEPRQARIAAQASEAKAVLEAQLLGGRGADTGSIQYQVPSGSALADPSSVANLLAPEFIGAADVIHSVTGARIGVRAPALLPRSRGRKREVAAFSAMQAHIGEPVITGIIPPELNEQDQTLSRLAGESPTDVMKRRIGKMPSGKEFLESDQVKAAEPGAQQALRELIEVRDDKGTLTGYRSLMNLGQPESTMDKDVHTGEEWRRNFSENVDGPKTPRMKQSELASQATSIVSSIMDSLSGSVDAAAEEPTAAAGGAGGGGGGLRAPLMGGEGGFAGTINVNVMNWPAALLAAKAAAGGCGGGGGGGEEPPVPPTPEEPEPAGSSRVHMGSKVPRIRRGRGTIGTASSPLLVRPEMRVAHSREEREQVGEERTRQTMSKRLERGVLRLHSKGARAQRRADERVVKEAADEFTWQGRQANRAYETGQRAEASERSATSKRLSRGVMTIRRRGTVMAQRNEARNMAAADRNFVEMGHQANKGYETEQRRKAAESDETNDLITTPGGYHGPREYSPRAMAREDRRQQRLMNRPGGLGRNADVYSVEKDAGDDRMESIRGQLRMASRRVPKRGFGPSVVDLITSKVGGPGFERQLETFGRAEREAAELQTSELERARLRTDARAKGARLKEIGYRPAQGPVAPGFNPPEPPEIKAERATLINDLKKSHVAYKNNSVAIDRSTVKFKDMIKEATSAATVMNSFKAAALGSAVSTGIGAITTGIGMAVVAPIITAVGAAIVGLIENSIAPAVDTMLGHPGAATAATQAADTAYQQANGNRNIATSTFAQSLNLSMDQVGIGGKKILDTAQVEQGNKMLAAQAGAFLGNEWLLKNGGGQNGLTSGTSGTLGSAFQQTPAVDEIVGNMMRDSSVDFENKHQMGIFKDINTADYGSSGPSSERAAAFWNAALKKAGNTAIKFETDLSKTNSTIGAFQEQAMALRSIGANAVADRVEMGSYQITDQQGHAVTDPAVLRQMYLDLNNSGASTDLSTLLAGNEQTMANQFWQENASSRMARGVGEFKGEGVNVAQTGIDLAANQFGSSADSASGLSGKALLPGEKVSGLKTIANLYQQVNEEQKIGVETAKAFVGHWLEGDEAVQSFSTALDKVQTIGGQISKIQIGREMVHAAYAAEQYSFQLYQANRSLRDARSMRASLSGGGNTNTLGGIQGRQTVLQEQSQGLQLGLSQKQINLQRAMAGFVTAGDTPEERAARIEQAKIEADYAQKQLNIQKQLFSLGKKGIRITADRSVIDLGRQIDLLKEGRSITLNDAAAQKKVKALNTLMGKEMKTVNTIFNQAQTRANDLLGTTAKFANELKKDAASVFLEITKYYINFYKRMTGLATTGRDPGASQDQTARRENAEHKDLNGNGIIGAATGFMGNISQPTNFTVGEVKGEMVTVLRNPRAGTASDLGGGGGAAPVFNIYVTGNNIRGEDDIDSLVYKIERKLNQKAAMLGYRRPV